MRAICKVCGNKGTCSYLKQGYERDCIDVQASDYGYEEAVDKACEWLETNYGHFDGSLEDLLIDFRKAMENK